jgi:hypothetical protein
MQRLLALRLAPDPKGHAEESLKGYQQKAAKTRTGTIRRGPAWSVFVGQEERGHAAVGFGDDP